MDEPDLDLAVFSPAANYSSVARYCGANSCPGISAADNPNLLKPDAAKLNTLAAIFLGCMLAAFLLVAFALDSLKR